MAVPGIPEGSQGPVEGKQRGYRGGPERFQGSQTNPRSLPKSRPRLRGVQKGGPRGVPGDPPGGRLAKSKNGQPVGRVARAKGLEEGQFRGFRGFLGGSQGSRGVRASQGVSGGVPEVSRHPKPERFQGVFLQAAPYTSPEGGGSLESASPGPQTPRRVPPRPP